MTTQILRSPNLSFIQKLGHAIFRLIGWRPDTIYPTEPKYVLVGAHHTSNWDLPIAVVFMMATGIWFNFLAKDEAFRWPIMREIMRWLGGIPVNRRAQTNFVDQIAETFASRERLVIAITPEGTRRHTDYWKTGFYYIALAAKVPLALGYLDYPRKRLGVGKMMMPTGDIEADLEKIREFYADKVGKFPHEQGEIRLRPRDVPGREMPAKG